MKVVLLAAGRSRRIAPIADKNFLKFLGKPLIAHQIEALKKAGFNEILIVGGKHNLSALKKFGCTVREQTDLDLGMAGAVLSAANWIKKDPFLVVSSNDVTSAAAYELIKKNIKKGEGLLLSKKVNEYFPGGYLKANLKGVISEIVEKPGKGNEPSKLVNIVMHFHPDAEALVSAINKELKAKNRNGDDIYEKSLQSLFDKKIIYRALPFDGFWQPVKYPWHVLALMNGFLKLSGKKKARNVEIAPSAIIKGDVYLEEGVRIMENAVIVGSAYIGANTVIANNTLVRGSHIGANCVIGFASEVARSFIGDGVWTHSNYIGDSVIGSDVSFGAGSVTGNLRLDEKNISVFVNEHKLNSGINKLGIITGDHIRVGINVSFMPGVKIGSNSSVGAGITVARDVPENSFITGNWELKVLPNKEKIEPRGLLSLRASAKQSDIRAQRE